MKLIGRIYLAVALLIVGAAAAVHLELIPRTNDENKHLSLAIVVGYVALSWLMLVAAAVVAIVFAAQRRRRNWNSTHLFEFGLGLLLLLVAKFYWRT